MRSSPRREISSHSATRVVMAFFGLDGYGSSLSDSSDVEDVEYDERGEIIVKPKAAATRDEPRGDDDDEKDDDDDDAARDDAPAPAPAPAPRPKTSLLPSLAEAFDAVKGPPAFITATAAKRNVTWNPAHVASVAEAARRRGEAAEDRDRAVHDAGKRAAASISSAPKKYRTDEYIAMRREREEEGGAAAPSAAAMALYGASTTAATSSKKASASGGAAGRAVGADARDGRRRVLGRGARRRAAAEEEGRERQDGGREEEARGGAERPRQRRVEVGSGDGAPSAIRLVAKRSERTASMRFFFARARHVF